MRLINVKTITLEEFFGDKVPPYAILSHTWGSNHDEVQFKDIENEAAKEKSGYKKIQYLCQQATSDGLDWAWCDTCCIDKSSSAELSESINSMFQWYQDANICYAYLSDVSTTAGHSENNRQIHESRWFTRGWTLQELLAPEMVCFYNGDWSLLGYKSSLQDELLHITGVNFGAINYPFSIPSYSIATRMSWASGRKTTRTEDQAYCMLGILGVHMPLLYGEGQNAFRRLQEELIKISDDETIFAHSGREILAQSPQEFSSGSDLTFLRKTISAPYSMTNSGLQIHMRVWKLEAEANIPALGVLNCYYNNVTDRDSLLALPLKHTGIENTYRKVPSPPQLVNLAWANAVEYQTIFIQLRPVRISRITLLESFDPSTYASQVHPHGSSCVYNGIKREVRLYPKPTSQFVAVLHAFENRREPVHRNFGVITFFDLMDNKTGVLILDNHSPASDPLDICATYKTWEEQGKPSSGEIPAMTEKAAPSASRIQISIVEKGQMNQFFWFLRVTDGSSMPKTKPSSSSVSEVGNLEADDVCNSRPSIWRDSTAMKSRRTIVTTKSSNATIDRSLPEEQLRSL